ncbi:hypothetical protein CAEBREN_03760 [Caenorhabditis brenneri]|uniref:DNA methyltransferase 1-associated protein 1 n=1 Tax=Caenorhabditis brenneri TaxID=135651 RepID=G0NCL1_CAEBE|nr:hypothetical protein CAEBREN_03760 [Caenorhabditis brenneri]
MIGDVQQILQCSEPSTSNVKKTPKAGQIQKKPEGMKRELFNLIAGKDLTSVMPTDVKKTYKQKFQTGFRAVRKYKWMPFINEGREDGLQLHHWVRSDRIDPETPYPFAKFNKSIDVVTYTDDEYNACMRHPKWSREETDYLFEMCRRFDIRWLIVYDRYDCKKFGVNRTMEDLKERFYNTSYDLNMMRDPCSSQANFDAEHERRRKEQLNKQWNRTPEQLKEEEDLTAELRRIELRKKEREKKAHDLQKLINMTEQPASPSAGGVGGAATAKRKNVFRTKAGSISVAMPMFNPNDMSTTALRFSEFKSSGAHFRCQEMKLPTNIGQKKLKNIEVVLEKCKMEMNPVASESIMKTYNDFRSQIIMVQDLKSAMQTAEFELESLRTRMQEQGKDFDIEPRFRISQLNEGGLDEDAVGGPGQAATARRITSYVDASNKDITQIASRKRKTLAVTPTQNAAPSTSMAMGGDPKRPRKI